MYYLAHPDFLNEQIQLLSDAIGEGLARNDRSAGKARSGRTHKGPKWLCAALEEGRPGATPERRARAPD